MKKYIVRLSKQERQELQTLVGKGRGAAYKIRHANILLTVDANGPGWTDPRTAEALGCHENTVRNVRQRFVGQGLAAAVERKKQRQPSRQRVLDGEGEARLIALACSQAPEGRSRWTLQLLADTLVQLSVVESISDQTVRRTLKKTNCGRICSNAG